MNRDPLTADHGSRITNDFPPMRIPLSWLKDYVDLDESPRQIADRLTFSGTEVEGIETVGSTYEGFIVAEVRSVGKHPNADKLSLCHVFDGRQELQVVCGAPNVQAGGRYPFAPVGVTLPDGSLTIKKAKIRGVESFGMLCSESELGLSQDHSGLLALDAKWPAGTPLADVLGPPETVLELEVTPNRPDCLSLIGIARELAAVYRRPLRIPAVALAESGPAVDTLARVEVEDAQGCPRYTARVVSGVKVGPSPAWMQKRLQLAGIRAINNLVDITNYVMLECGQPLHAFDRDLLRDGRIVVRRARAGERMTTLDGIDRELGDAMLVIADAARPVAVAGVMGGAGSEIRDATTTVLLESAAFKPTSVRSTARKLGLSTESSYRFERGVDVENVEWAGRRAAALLAELGGGAVARGVIDVRAPASAARRIPARFDYIRDLVGVEASNEDIAGALRALGLGVEPAAAGRFEAVVPSFRGDLEREIDLVEEFARMHGLDRIPTPTPRATVDPQASADAAVRGVRKLRDALAGLGVSEIVNYSLVSDALLDMFHPQDRAVRVAIPRPLSADQSVLRTSLVPQLVETLGRNRAHQVEDAALYEIGRVWRRTSDGAIEETTRLAIGLLGPVGRAGMDRRRAIEPSEMFLWAKGLLEALLAAMRIETWSLQPASHPALENGVAVDVLVAGRPAGALGLVPRRIRGEWRLNDPVAVLDLDVDTLTAAALAIPSFREIPAYPSVARDVAMIVADDVRHEDIEQVIRRHAPAELESVRIFDIFKGGSIGPGRRSVAYSLTYRSAARTLTDEEANGYHEVVKSALRRELRAEIRES